MGRKPKSSPSFLSIIRPIFTIIVLSAFVLGISFFVKTLATSDTKKIVRSLRPLLGKLNIDETRAGQVAGDFASRLSQTGITKEISSINAVEGGTVSAASTESRHVVANVAFLSDAHDNTDNLTSALKLADDYAAKFVFYLGDYTNYGELDKLSAAKYVMDAGGISYLSLPGDHDLYQTVGPQNFLQVFGKNHFVHIINGVKFVALDNSANFTTINDDIMAWFGNEVVDADFVLLSQPLYHPTFNVVMGIVSGEENTTVRNQAVELLNIIRESEVKAIIASDQHLSSKNIDPKKPALSHIVVGALTEERNLQSPRFSMLEVFNDGSYQIDDVLLK